MGHIKDLQKSLLNEISKRIVKYGFDGKPKGQSFYKPIASGCQSFTPSFINHKTDVDVTGNVAVRFDALEDLINEYRPYLTKAQKKYTASLGVELGNLGEGAQKRWVLADLDDAGEVAEEILDYFAKVGLPYLEKYSDMEAALDALSANDRGWLYSPFPDERAKRAIGLAFLLGNKERFFEIAAAKTEFLTSRNEQGLDTFLKIKSDLEKRLKASKAHSSK